MKPLTLTLICLFCGSVYCAGQNQQNPSNEKIVKGYFSGWANKDWDTVSSHLADGFTFTSAAPDDHISIEKFKEKCWVQAQYIERFEFPKIISNRNEEAFAIVHVITKDHKVIRNVEYFRFEKGKIKSIEVFFGGNGQGFPSNEE